MNWQQYQELIKKNAKQSDRIIAKMAKNPSSRKYSEWNKQVLDLQVYEQDEIDYLVAFKREQNETHN